MDWSDCGAGEMGFRLPVSVYEVTRVREAHSSLLVSSALEQVRIG